MTEQRLIHGSHGEQRYLHSDEVFRKERNWNINLPSEREFKDGYCIITDKDNTAYSTDELVELLNEFQNENEQLKSIKKFADRNGICIFNIDEAFRRCWQDNAKLVKENEQLKQRIKSRLHYYRELCNEFEDDGFTYNIVKRIVEDLEDILK